MKRFNLLMDTSVPENPKIYLRGEYDFGRALQKRNQRAKGMRKEKTEAKRKHGIMNSITKFSSLIYNPSFLSSYLLHFRTPFALSILHFSTTYKILIPPPLRNYSFRSRCAAFFP